MYQGDWRGRISDGILFYKNQNHNKLIDMCNSPDDQWRNIWTHTQTNWQIVDRYTSLSYKCFGAFKKQMVLCNHSNAKTWFGEYSQSLLQRELSERTESSESLRESFESFHTNGEFFPPVYSSNPSLEAQIPAQRPKSQSLGPNPSLEAQIQVLRPKP